MTYKEQLSPWCIIRPLPQSQSIVVARFRNRNSAEDRLRLLRQKLPDHSFSIVFDPMRDSADASAESEQSTEEKIPDN